MFLKYSYQQNDDLVCTRVLGQGYATEAVVAVVAYLFESLNAPAIMAYTRPENQRSARVLQKTGFRSGGELIEDEAYKLCDVYEISKSEWKEIQGTRGTFPARD
jgi:RimJ/RimL family protein N-acetyltransferase